MSTRKLLLMLVSILFAASGCDKEYGYDFKDGVDSGGEKGDITVDTSMSMIDRSLYHKARIFPGMVSPLEPRLTDHEVTLHLNYTPTDHLGSMFPHRGFTAWASLHPLANLSRWLCLPGWKGLPSRSELTPII